MDAQRFILSATQLAEGFAAAGCIPASAGLFEGLPSATGILPDNLAGPNGDIDSAIRALLETIARPAVSLRAAGEGSVAGNETHIVGDDRETYVAFARIDPEGWEFVLLRGRGAVLALIDALLGPPEMPRAGITLSAAIASALASGEGDSEGAAPASALDVAICRRCGTLYEDSPAFCRECGTPLLGG